jgi:hypothetical protein
MEIIVASDTDLQLLIGREWYTEHFGPFRMLSADHAPELNAIAYSARDVESGYWFMAFLPYGKVIIAE